MQRLEIWSVGYLRGKTCPCCKHNFEDEDTAPCKDNGLVYGCSQFEWRGLQE